jgi:hypothetical protein
MSHTIKHLLAGYDPSQRVGIGQQHDPVLSDP